MSVAQLNDPSISGLLSPQFASVSANGKLQITAPTAPNSSTVENAEIDMTSANQIWKWFNTTNSGGGLADGHLSLYQYPATGGVTQYLDMSPADGSSAGGYMTLHQKLNFVNPSSPVFGQVTANGGTEVSVTCPQVTANSVVILSCTNRASAGGASGLATVIRIQAGVGFGIANVFSSYNSGDGDTGVYNWLVLN